MIKKILITLFVTLFFGNLSFAAGGDGGSTKRTVHSLGVRVSIAVVLFITLVYGFLTGQIGPGV